MSKTNPVWWWAFGAAALLVCAGAALAYARGVPAVVAVRGLDKVLHCAMTTVLTALLDRAMKQRPVSRARWGASVPCAAVVVMVPVGIEEWAQRFSTCRTSSIDDFAADALGAALGVVLARAGVNAGT